MNRKEQIRKEKESEKNLIDFVDRIIKKIKESKKDFEQLEFLF